MSDYNKEKMLEDLKFIKESVKKNHSIFNYVNFWAGLELVGLIGGIGIILICTLFLTMDNLYGGFTAIPLVIKIIMFLTIIVYTVTIGFWKSKILLKTAREHRNDFDLKKLFKEVYTKKVLNVAAPFLIALITGIIYLNTNNLDYLTTPFIAALTGLVMSSVLQMLNIKNGMLTSYWILITGIVLSFFAKEIHTAVIIMLTFGIGFILMYVSVLLSKRYDKKGSGEE